MRKSVMKLDLDLERLDLLELLDLLEPLVANCGIDFQSNGSESEVQSASKVLNGNSEA